MSFRTGSLSYARFKLSGLGGKSAPVHVEEQHLELLKENTLRPTTLGEPQPVEFGWCGGRHVFDESFNAFNSVFGDTLLFGMRIDTNKVPGDLKRAYRAIAEAAFAEDSGGGGFLSRREKMAAKEEADERCRQELTEGKHRKSKMVDVWWDMARSTLLTPIWNDANTTGLRDLITESFDLKTTSLSSGGLAWEILSSKGRTRDYEDLKPTAFTTAPAGFGEGDDAMPVDSGRPSVPWAHITPEASDFVGNEFLLWLWWQLDTEGGIFDTSSGEVSIAIDRVLDMECPWNVTGKQGLTADGPSRSPEAKRGLKSGKWPRKTGIIVATDHQQWEATFQADRFVFTGIKMPKPDEDAAPASPRELTEFRLASLRCFDIAMVSLFELFLDKRTDDSWNSTRDRIARWINGQREPTVIHVEPKVKNVTTTEEAQSNSNPEPVTT